MDTETMRAQLRSPGLARHWFAVQGAAVALWWVWIGQSPTAAAAFTLRDAPVVTLAAFAPGDLLFIATGSIAVWMGAGRAWMRPLAWMVAGAMTYAMLYAGTAWAVGAANANGVLLMLPAALGSGIACASLDREASA